MGEGSDKGPFMEGVVGVELETETRGELLPRLSRFELAESGEGGTTGEVEEDAPVFVSEALSVLPSLLVVEGRIGLLELGEATGEEAEEAEEDLNMEGPW